MGMLPVINFYLELVVGKGMLPVVFFYFNKRFLSAVKCSVVNNTATKLELICIHAPSVVGELLLSSLFLTMQDKNCSLSSRSFFLRKTTVIVQSSGRRVGVKAKLRALWHRTPVW